MLSLASALPVAGANDGVGNPQTKSGQFSLTASVVTTSSHPFSATFSHAVSTVATTLSSGKENTFTATDLHLEKILPKLQNSPTTMQIATTNNAVTTNAEVPVSLIFPPAVVLTPEEKPPPTTVGHEGIAVGNICTIEDIPDLPDD